MACKLSWTACLTIALGCRSASPPSGSADAAESPKESNAMSKVPVRSDVARERGLEIQLELDPAIVVDRVPMRTLVLVFRNTSTKPIRVFMPPEPFRANISSIVLAASGSEPVFEPPPRPHGYRVSEKDFHSIAPLGELRFQQRFTIDPFGRGTTTVRRRGFEDGALVDIHWTYENTTTTWPGGANTLDGTTKPLFGGEPVPDLWTGKLSVRAKWRVGS